MPVSKDYLPIAGASGSQETGYTLSQSIRFNDDDSARMGRTPGVVGNRRTWTLSMWVKRANLNSSGFHFLFSRAEASIASWIGFYQDTFAYGSASGGHEARYYTTRVFRDPSAWYHFVVASDTTQTSPEDRVRIYVNGERETSFGTLTVPSINYQSYFNTTSLHDIGVSRPSGSISGYFDGYMAEFHWLDGTAYGPEYFGEFNSDGIWIAKEYEGGNYGTNGFYIKGEDSSDLGNDSSGNNNDYSPSGLAAHDQVLDVPTNNFCVLNPLYGLLDLTLRDGNLDVQGSTATYRRTIGTQGVSTGKWYYEGYIVATTVNNPGFGWVLTTPENWANYSLIGTGAHEVAGIFAATGQTHVGKAYVNNVLSSSYTSTTAAGDIFGIAVDFDNQGFYIHKNGTYYNSGDPTSGASKTGSLDASGMEAGAEYIPAASSQDTNSRAHLNFGQDGTFGGRTTAGGNTDGNGIGNFKHSVPSGYLALCTNNLFRT